MPIRMVGKEASLRRVNDGVENHVRRVIVAFDQAIVSGTPVDTGRARANWFMSFGRVSARETDSLAVPDTLRGNRWKITDGNIYVHNSVEYIVYLDEGSSAQAPQGLIDPALAAIRGLF